MEVSLSQDGLYDPTMLITTKKGYADVLALVTSTGPWSPAALASLDIAAKFNAHVTGCYVDPSLRSLAGIDSEPTVMALLVDEQRVARGDYEAFRALALSRGVRHVSWQSTQVAPAKTMRALGAWHDLIVLERDLAEESRLIDVLGEALMTCRAPCLVLPPYWDKPIGMKRLAIGWDGSIESIRATHAALPLVLLADHIVILRDSALASGEGRQPSFDPVMYLRSHGANVSEKLLHATPKSSGASLLSEAKKLSADCLVMGAYGHARVRERVLGGATRHVLQHAEIPLLMQH